MYFFSEYTPKAYYVVRKRLLFFQTIDELGIDVTYSILMSACFSQKKYE